MTVPSHDTRLAEAAGPLSHTRQWHAGVVQAASPAGVLDLGPGYLQPELLPVDLIRDAYQTALADVGAAALSYGANAGASAFRTVVADRTSAVDGRQAGPDNFLVTAGTSQALQLLSTGVARPGDIVLVEPTAYDLGRRIFADHLLEIQEVPADADGMIPAALRAAGRRNLAAGRRLAFVYLNPTFHNPTGRLTGVRRRLDLIAAAAELDALIVEDDAYGELGLDGAAPVPSMVALAGHRGVIRLGSFAKTLAPGLRLGWLQADPTLVDTLTEKGQLTSGGSLNHVTSLAVAVLLRDGRYDRHLRWLRDHLRIRRDALVDGLREHLAPKVEYAVPAGGFFLWLRFPPGCRETSLVAAAAAAGVAVAPGSRFGSVDRPSLRLAYSFHPPTALATAAGALALVWKRISS